MTCTVLGHFIFITVIIINAVRDKIVPCNCSLDLIVPKLVGIRCVCLYGVCVCVSVESPKLFLPDTKT